MPRSGSVIVLYDMTKEKLGIDISKLNPGSHTKAYVECRECGEVFTREFRNISQPHACPTHIILNGHKYKWCDGCSTQLPYSSFVTDESRYDGLSNICIQCSNGHACVKRTDTSDVRPAHYARLEYKLLSENGKIPFRKKTFDAGYDVFSAVRVSIEPGGHAKINTDIIISPPDGYYFTIEGRSSLGVKGVVPFRGIIDGTYQGPLLVTLINTSDVEYIVEVGDRIAQIIIHKVINADFTEVQEFSPVQDGRSTDGFGSSGK